MEYALEPGLSWDLPLLDMSPEDFRVEQGKDVEWAAVRAFLQDGTQPTAPDLRAWLDARSDDFVLQDGIVKRVDTARRGKALTVRLQTVIPLALRRRLLTAYHAHPAAGAHMDGVRTYTRLRQHFWWPRMCSDTLDFVGACLVCQARTAKTTGKAPVQPHSAPTQPFELVAMDLLAMPPSTAGNSYALVVVDHFSRYAIVAPIPDKTAATVARVFMERVVLQYGRPQALLTDQGGEFKNKLVADLCRLAGIRKVFTSPYRPQADGRAERFNRTLLKLISVYVSEAQDNWDQVLPYVLYAFNTAYSRAAGDVPFSIIFGKDPPPMALHDVLQQSGQLRAVADPAAWRKEIQAFLQDDVRRVDQAQAAARKARERDAVNESRTLRPLPAVGTLVWLQNNAPVVAPAKPKLARKMRGLYVVMAHLPPVNVRIRKVADAAGKLSTVHVDLIQPVRGGRRAHIVLRHAAELPASDVVDVAPDDTDAAPFEVSSIEGMRVRAGQLEFRVRWKGYTAKDDEWLREADLDCPHLVDTFVASAGDALFRRT